MSGGGTRATGTTAAVPARTDLDAETRRVFPPCRSKCPVRVDVPAYLTAIAEGRYSDALGVVLERNPLPAVCGRVCLRECEAGCRRCNLDEPVAIAHLKRAAADFGCYPSVSPAPRRPESVGVVGGGPSGLTAAYDLAMLGFEVTIYEAMPLLGGMLRYGIPNYRLPDYAVERDLEHILAAGVQVRTGVRVGTDITVEELHSRHDALVLAAGLQGSRALPIPGADLPGVLTALPLLASASRGERPALGPRVVVIGGGNVAVDVARTARRLGSADVRMVCLEREDEMPASPGELAEARLEGVKVHCGWGPRDVQGSDAVRGLHVMRCTAVFDGDGRFSPTFDEGRVERFPTDTIVFATGQSAEARDLGVELTARGTIQADVATLTTSMPGVYAAGDVVSGPTKAVDAIASGHRAAATVVRDLTGDPEPLAELDEESVVLGSVPESMKSRLDTRRRIGMEKLEFYEAVETFDEVERGYTEYEAAREAQRCLGCASGARLAREKCASCLTCVRVCPYGAPGLKVGGFLYFDAEVCHACGACASQCPAQAISLEGHSDEEMALRVEHALRAAKPGATLAFACGCTPNPPDIPGGDVHTLTVTCLLRVSERVALSALRIGAEHIAFTGCVEANCRYPHTRQFVARRTDAILSMLSELAMDGALIVTPESPEEDVHLR